MIALSCTHDGTELIRTHVNALVQVARRKKDAALLAVADQVLAALGYNADITLCPSCGCVQQDDGSAGAHSH